MQLPLMLSPCCAAATAGAGYFDRHHLSSVQFSRQRLCCYEMDTGLAPSRSNPMLVCRLCMCLQVAMKRMYRASAKPLGGYFFCSHAAVFAPCCCFPLSILACLLLRRLCSCSAGSSSFIVTASWHKRVAVCIYDIMLLLCRLLLLLLKLLASLLSGND